jgi:hypothetical protein
LVSNALEKAPLGQQVRSPCGHAAGAADTTGAGLATDTTVAGAAADTTGAGAAADASDATRTAVAGDATVAAVAAHVGGVAAATAQGDCSDEEEGTKVKCLHGLALLGVGYWVGSQ